MSLFVMFILWVGFGVFCSWYATQKGRDPFIWFVLGAFLGIFGVILLFFLPNVEPEGKVNSDNPEPSPEEPMVELLPAPPKVLYPDQKEWYYLDRQKHQQGPVGIGALRQEWNQGNIDLETYVWCENLEKWFKIHELKDLESSLQRY